MKTSFCRNMAFPKLSFRCKIASTSPGILLLCKSNYWPCVKNTVPGENFLVRNFARE